MAFITTPTVTPLSGGVTAIVGEGEEYQFVVGPGSGPAWVTGDTWSFVFTDGLTAVQTQVGAGTITGVMPTFVYAFQDKLNFLAGTTWYFSELNNFSSFNDPNGTGNGYIDLADYFDAPTPGIAMANYQGRLAIFGANNIQVWEVDADPTLYDNLQTLENIGTLAGESVQGLGDLDVLFLHSTGFRSLRVRDSSLNAFVVDIGSAIDSLVQAQVITQSQATIAASCGVTDPSTGRYWCFVGNTIYVLSYFPSIKITAWSQYTPQYWNGTEFVKFTPVKFVILNNQIYCRATDGNIYLFGGTDNVTYDATEGYWETSFLDMKMPGFKKELQTFGFALSGGWQVQVSTDPKFTGELGNVYDNSMQQNTTSLQASTYDIGSVTCRSSGTHVQISGNTVGSGPCVFSSLFINFSKGNAI